MKRLIFFPLFLLTISLVAQEPVEESGPKTIQSSFNEMMAKSNRYQDFKVVKRTKLEAFMREVQDSLNVHQQNFKADAQTKSNLQKEIDKLNGTIIQGESMVSQLEGQRDNIESLGMNFQKGSFATGMWIAVLALLGLLIALFLRNKSIAISQRNVKSSLSEIENELTAVKKKALEREQELKREVQDYVNKIEAMGPPR